MRAQLQKLPHGLEDTYERIWAKITKNSGSTQKKWALKVLGWVLCALRPLSSMEILEATAIDPLDAFFDRNKKAYKLEHLIRVCAGFVELDEKRKVLRFVHFSVQEFLKSRLSSAEDLIADVCFTVLGFTKEGPFSRNYFYNYVIWYWQEHASSWRVIDSNRDVLLRKLFFDQSNFAEWNSIRQVESTVGSYNIFSISTFESVGDSLPTPDQAASYFNLPIIVQHLLQKASQDMKFHLQIPRSLCIAAHRGHAEVVELLLKSGTDINAQVEHWGTALHVAASRGNVKVIELLLRAGADPHAKREFSSSSRFKYAIFVCGPKLLSI